MENFFKIKESLLNNLKTYLKEENDCNKLEDKVMFNLFELKKNHNNFFCVKENENDNKIEKDIKQIEIYKYKLNNLKKSLINIKNFKLNYDENKYDFNINELNNAKTIENLKEFEKKVSDKLQNQLDDKISYNSRIKEKENNKLELIKINKDLLNEYDNLNNKIKDSNNYFKLNLLKNYIKEMKINMKDKYISTLNKIENDEFKKFIIELFLIKINNSSKLKYAIHKSSKKELYKFYLTIKNNKLKWDIYYHLKYKIFLVKIYSEIINNNYKEAVFINPINKDQIEINSEFYLLSFNTNDYSDLKIKFTNMIDNLANLENILKIINNKTDSNINELIEIFKIPQEFKKNQNLKNWINDYFYCSSNNNTIIKKLDFNKLCIFIILDFNLYNLSFNFKIIKNLKNNYFIDDKNKDRELEINNLSFSEKLILIKDKKFD